MRFLFSLLLVLSFLFLCSVVVETASLREFIYGSTNNISYDNWLSHTSEGLLEDSPNTYAPFDRQLNGFGDYYDPEPEELGYWNFLVQNFLEGNIELAENALLQSDMPFEIVEFQDTDTGKTYMILREQLNNEYFDDNETDDSSDDVTGSFDYGWGIYINNPESTSHVIVNVVHPNDDFIAPPIAVKAFQDWNARYLFIDGTGREVAGSSYDSDPSRNQSHPFNTAYIAACDLIRLNTSRRELSIQIHSYDWNSHGGRSACQVSAGNYRRYPDLPIRDTSHNKFDLINLTDYVVVPENSIHNNDMVTIDDYYSVYYHYSVDFTYTHFEEEFEVNDSVDLPGYSYNRQMEYTSPDSLNYLDIQEPFFHLEMDEFPNCYMQTEENYESFYSGEDGIFNYGELYLNTIEFYTPWVDAMTQALEYLHEMDDGTAPQTPEDFHSPNYLGNSITLEWERISSYDFKGYEILYSQNPISLGEFSVLNRNDYYQLASQETDTLILSSSPEYYNKYMAIRTLDYNGNISEISPEIFINTLPVAIQNVIAVGLEGETTLSWEAVSEEEFLGFSIFRSLDEFNYELIDSFETNSGLLSQPGELTYYSYRDVEQENGVDYYYRISVTGVNGVQMFSENEAESNPSEIYTLKFTVDGQKDTLYFSSNEQASSGLDPFDKAKDNYTEAGFYSAFSILYYDTVYEREVVSTIQSNYQASLNLYMQSGSDSPVEVNVQTDYYERGGNRSLVLKNYETEQMSDFYLGDVNFELNNSTSTEYALLWGKVLPEFEFVRLYDRVLRGGENLWINWDLQQKELVSHMSLRLKGDYITIPIVDDISVAIDSILVTIPDGYNEEYLEFQMIVQNNLGEQFVYPMYSSKMMLVESMQLINIEPGWQGVSWPFQEAEMELAELLGNNYVSYEYDFQQGFIDYPVLSDSTPGILYSEVAASYFSSDNIVSSSYEHEINTGWNYVGNKIPMNMIFSSIWLDGIALPYACEIGAVMPKIIEYRNGAYEQISEIGKFEPFFMYVNDPSLEYLEHILRNTYNPYYVMPVYEANLAEICFSQETRATLMAGYADNSSDGFDFEYDYPAYPEFPENQVVSAALITQDVGGDMPFYKLSQECVEMEDGEAVDLSWQFQVKPQSLDQMYVALKSSTLPQGVNIYMELGGVEFELSSEDIAIIPETLETISGWIHLRDESVLSEEDVLAPVDGFRNYPNPFNPETAFSFSLGEEEKVNLEIYNIKGQRVKSLINEVLPMGKYEQIWNGFDENGSRVASGVYLGRLSIGNKCYNRKLLLLK